MGKMHLDKDDVKRLINHLKNYDSYVCDGINNYEDAEKINELIEEHDSIEALINKLERW
jgi:hypothetical protein